MIQLSEQDIVQMQAAHKHSSHNKEEMQKSYACGCFYCLRQFSPLSITEWADDGETALCPHCNTDSVIGSASCYLSGNLFLMKMQRHWFSVKQPSSNN